MAACSPAIMMMLSGCDQVCSKYISSISIRNDSVWSTVAETIKKMVRRKSAINELIVFLQSRTKRSVKIKANREFLLDSIGCTFNYWGRKLLHSDTQRLLQQSSSQSLRLQPLAGLKLLHICTTSAYIWGNIFSLSDLDPLRLCVSFLTCRHVEGDHCNIGLPDDLQTVLALIQTWNLFHQHGQQVCGHATLNVFQDDGVLGYSFRF